MLVGAAQGHKENPYVDKQALLARPRIPVEPLKDWYAVAEGGVAAGAAGVPLMNMTRTVSNATYSNAATVNR